TAGLDSARYNAIASTVEFGGTFMFNSPGRPQLMRNYLEFLGFRTTPLCASLTADNTHVCRYNKINFTAYTSGTVNRLRWSFPGGEPQTSEEENPQIRYDTPGLYNVSLTVEDGASGSNTFTLEDYILVENCTGMDEHAESNYFVYPNPAGRMATLICPDRPESVNIRMIDLSGRTVFETSVVHPETNIQLKLPALSEDLYMLIIRTRETQNAIKLLIHQPG
ncbi:MAG: PKD domain-containing protein, partial [Lentimicrobium sp.]|uniref:PKD domain-containing protein n=1 Tax=Lentimicrobium sp. TaxID=2034841 RepID=UPI0025FFA517